MGVKVGAFRCPVFQVEGFATDHKDTKDAKAIFDKLSGLKRHPGARFFRNTFVPFVFLVVRRNKAESYGRHF